MMLIKGRTMENGWLSRGEPNQCRDVIGLLDVISLRSLSPPPRDLGRSMSKPPADRWGN